MLAAPYRLKDNEELEKVKEKGELYQSPLFGLLVLKRRDKEGPRFGFVVSNKVSNKAAIRNKAKRALREGVRHQIAFIKSGLSIVFLAKITLARAYTADTIKEVARMLKKAQVSN